MIKRYNNLSFLFFIPGIILQLVGLGLSNASETQGGALAASLLIIGGTILAVTGFAYYAKAKGQSPVFGMVGLLGILGLVILALLKDRSGDPWNT